MYTTKEAEEKKTEHPHASLLHHISRLTDDITL